MNFRNTILISLSISLLVAVGVLALTDAPDTQYAQVIDYTNLQAEDFPKSSETIPPSGGTPVRQPLEGEIDLTFSYEFVYPQNTNQNDPADASIGVSIEDSDYQAYESARAQARLNDQDYREFERLRGQAVLSDQDYQEYERLRGQARISDQDYRAYESSRRRAASQSRSGLPTLDQTQGFQDALNNCPPGVRCVLNQPSSRNLQNSLNAPLPSGRGSTMLEKIGDFVGGPTGEVIKFLGGYFGGDTKTVAPPWQNPDLPTGGDAGLFQVIRNSLGIPLRIPGSPVPLGSALDRALRADPGSGRLGGDAGDDPTKIDQTNLDKRLGGDAGDVGTRSIDETIPTGDTYQDRRQQEGEIGGGGVSSDSFEDYSVESNKSLGYTPDRPVGGSEGFVPGVTDFNPDAYESYDADRGDEDFNFVNQPSDVSSGEPFDGVSPYNDPYTNNFFAQSQNYEFSDPTFYGVDPNFSGYDYSFDGYDPFDNPSYAFGRYDFDGFEGSPTSLIDIPGSSDFNFNVGAGRDTFDDGGIFAGVDTGVGFSQSVLGGSDASGIGSIGETVAGAVSGDLFSGVLDSLKGAAGAIGGAISSVFGGAGGLASGALGSALDAVGLGAISGLVGLGGGEHVPVKDFEAIATQKKILSENAKQTALLRSLVVKEYDLDPQAHAASNEAVTGALKQLFNHVNYGNNGNPYYVTNVRNYYQDTSDRELQILMAELDRVFRGNNLIQGSVAQVYRDENRSSFQRLITPTVSNAQVGAFMQDFNNGGWGMWLQMLQPNNNPYGQFTLAEQERERRQSQALEEERQKLAWGRGFQPKQVCLAKDYRGNCLYQYTVTPGATYQAGAADALKTLLEQMAANDELKESASPFVRTAFSNALGGASPTGFKSAGGNPFQPPPVDAASVANTKRSLLTRMDEFISNELAYTTNKTKSLILLKETESILNTLVFFQKNNSTSDKVRQAEDIAFAEKLLSQIIKPAAQTITAQIIESAAIVEKIAAIKKELDLVSTAEGVARIGEKFALIMPTIHGGDAVFAAEEELATITNVNNAAKDRAFESILGEIKRPSPTLLISSEAWSKFAKVFFGGEITGATALAGGGELPPQISEGASFSDGVRTLQEKAKTSGSEFAYAFTKKRVQVDSNGDGIDDTETEVTKWIFLTELETQGGFISNVSKAFEGKPNEVILLHNHPATNLEKHPPSLYDIMQAATNTLGPDNTPVSHGVVDKNGLWGYSVPQGSEFANTISVWQAILEVEPLGAAELNNALTDLRKKKPNDSAGTISQAVVAKALTGDLGINAERVTKALLGNEKFIALIGRGIPALLKMESTDANTRVKGVDDLLKLYAEYGVVIKAP
ncbi:MAG: hypothetical protein Q8R36_02720 [bacterium]|nr:hypothetical protein [bacterium]